MRSQTQGRDQTIMDVDRRHLIGSTAAGGGALALSSRVMAVQPISVLGRDATQYRLRPGSPDDQTKIRHRAIEEAARAQAPLAIRPGVYRTGQLRLPNGSKLVGVRGATRLVFTGGPSVGTR